MRITVQLTEEAADAMRRGGAGARPVREAADALGLTLTPLHPDVNDAALGRYFIAKAKGSPDVERILARLRQTPGVTAAYLKPPDALPG
jgi:hypothetical protein